MDIKKVAEKRTTYEAVYFHSRKTEEDAAAYVTKLMEIARWCQGTIVMQYGADAVIEISNGGSAVTFRPGDWIVMSGQTAPGRNTYRRMSVEAFKRDLEEI